MTTQLIYTVTSPTATPGTQDFYINISVENQGMFPVTLKALQVYLPMGVGENDLTFIDDTSSITFDPPDDWTQTTQYDRSGANFEVIFEYSGNSGVVIKHGVLPLKFSLNNITVNDSYGIASCKLDEFTMPLVANSEFDFSIFKPFTPDEISFTANTYTINAGDNVVVTWAGPSGWVYTITYGSVKLPQTTYNNGSVILPLLFSTDVTLQLTQTGQTPPTPTQIRIEVTPTISLTGTVQPTVNNLYQLALNWTSLGATSVSGTWVKEPLGLNASQTVGLSYADAQNLSCADYVLTADGDDTQASFTCAIAPPVINSFAPQLLPSATGYPMILKWDVSGAFYVEGSWAAPDSAPFNPIDQSAVIDAPYAPDDYTITAYVLSDVKTTKTIQLADFFPAPVIQQFSYVTDGDTLTITWEVLSLNAPVFSLQGSWQPASSASLPLTGTLTLNSPFEPIYTLSVRGLVEGQAMTRSFKPVLWRWSSTISSQGGIPFVINAADNQTYFVGYNMSTAPGDSFTGVGCYSTSKGLLSVFSIDGGQLTSIVTDTALEYLLTLDDYGNLQFYDINTCIETQGIPEPFGSSRLPYTFGGSVISPMVITPDNSSMYVASDSYIVVVDLANYMPNTFGTIGVNPTDIAITPNGDYVLIVFGNGYVIPVAVASFSQLATLSVGQNPCSIAITPNSQYAFVTCSGDDTVSVIDLNSLSVTATLSVGVKPQSLAITPDGNYVFVANAGSDTVSVIDANALTVVQTIQVGSGQKSIAMTPDSSCVFVSNNNTVSVIAVDGLFVVQTFTLGENNMTTACPLALSPDGNTLYVASDSYITLFSNGIEAN